MAIFGVEAQNNPELTDFVKLTNSRIESASLVRSPFKGHLKEYSGFVVVDINPIIPDISYFGIFMALAFLIFGLSVWFYLLLLPFLITALVHSQRFFYWVLKKGLIKSGYVGIIKPLSTKETLRRVVNVSA